MSLDGFTVVSAFLAVVEVALGGAAVVLGFREARARSDAGVTAPRRPLLPLVAAALAATAVVSIPVGWLLLESWIPRWPGVMCVAGVRRIGEGTVGASRFLPDLAAALDFTRILVLFAAGAWLVLRRSAAVGASRRAAIAAALLGAVALVDGAASFGFAVLPREEVHLEAGCCTVPQRGDERLAVQADGGDGLSGLLIGGAALLGAGALAARGRAGTGLLPLGVFALLAAASLPLAARFLAEVAAPAVLGLPYHRCSWCALERAPETAVGALLAVGAACSAGWAFLARWDDGPPAARPLLGAASFGFLGLAAMATVIVCLP